jgi:DNA-binding protein YbaB
VTGSSGSAAEELDRLLAQASQLLASVRTTTAAGGAERVGIGEAADGRVRASVGAGYKLTDLRIDPRAMRLESQALGEQIMQAVNAAVDDLREAGAAGAAVTPEVDVGELVGRLEELRTDSVRQMAGFTQSMDEVLTRLSRGTR